MVQERPEQTAARREVKISGEESTSTLLGPLLVPRKLFRLYLLHSVPPVGRSVAKRILRLFHLKPNRYNFSFPQAISQKTTLQCHPRRTCSSETVGDLLDLHETTRIAQKMRILFKCPFL